MRQRTFRYAEFAAVTGDPFFRNDTLSAVAGLTGGK